MNGVRKLINTTYNTGKTTHPTKWNEIPNTDLADWMSSSTHWIYNDDDNNINNDNNDDDYVEELCNVMSWAWW